MLGFLARLTEFVSSFRHLCQGFHPWFHPLQHFIVFFFGFSPPRFLGFFWGLALSCLINAVAGRTFPAGEGGSAAGSLLSSQLYLGLQAIARVPLSLYLGPRLVNVASCARSIFCPVPATQAMFVSLCSSTSSSTPTPAGGAACKAVAE
jgi:hypothetical protein